MVSSMVASMSSGRMNCGSTVATSTMLCTQMSSADAAATPRFSRRHDVWFTAGSRKHALTALMRELGTMSLECFAASLSRRMRTRKPRWLMVLRTVLHGSDMAATSACRSACVGGSRRFTTLAPWRLDRMWDSDVVPSRPCAVLATARALSSPVRYVASSHVVVASVPSVRLWSSITAARRCSIGEMRSSAQCTSDRIGGRISGRLARSARSLRPRLAHALYPASALFSSVRRSHMRFRPWRPRMTDWIFVAHRCSSRVCRMYAARSRPWLPRTRRWICSALCFSNRMRATRTRAFRPRAVLWMRSAEPLYSSRRRWTALRAARDRAMRWMCVAASCSSISCGMGRESCAMAVWTPNSSSKSPATPSLRSSPSTTVTMLASPSAPLATMGSLRACSTRSRVSWRTRSRCSSLRSSASCLRSSSLSWSLIWRRFSSTFRSSASARSSTTAAPTSPSGPTSPVRASSSTSLAMRASSAASSAFSATSCCSSFRVSSRALTRSLSTRAERLWWLMGRDLRPRVPDLVSGVSTPPDFSARCRPWRAPSTDGS